jgi:hypothetical protein
VTSAIADKLADAVSQRKKFAAEFLRHSEDGKRYLTSRLHFLRFWRAIGSDSNQTIGNEKTPSLCLPNRQLLIASTALSRSRAAGTASHFLSPNSSCLSVRYDIVS